jgi:hypothetical protein
VSCTDQFFQQVSWSQLWQYEKIIKSISNKPFASKNAYKVYSNMNHGWVSISSGEYYFQFWLDKKAAARADLDDPENKKEYEVRLALVASGIRH